MSSARLIIADSERNANLYYATRFFAPDAFVFAQINGKRILVMSDLEIDRARLQAKVDEIVSIAKLAASAKKRGVERPVLMDVVDELFRGYQVKAVEVPSDFSFAYANALKKRGYALTAAQEPFYPERLVKTEEEIAHITRTLRVTEDALACAIELIRNSQIHSDGTLTIGGKPLTSELLRKTMQLMMMEKDCIGQHTIVAGGSQGVDPHNEGTGPLRANEPIVMDVFPQDSRTRYYADLSRTVVKGKASDKIKKMFDAVKAGQEIAFGMIQDGVDGSAIHRAILASFEKLGFKTGEQDGRMQGFFHGTGHGVGLELHEPPRISPTGDILKAGMVVTVEPGLYYADAGGMRLEDMVVVRQDGCQQLNESPKVLEV